jgi:hypothetical protein
VETVRIFRDTTVSYFCRLTSSLPQDSSIDILTSLLKDGNSMERKPLSAGVMQKGTEKLLYSLLILASWRLQGYSPVLLDTGEDCKKMGVGTGKNDWTDPGSLNGLARVCREGRQYHMLASQYAYGCTTTVNAGPGTPASVNCNKKLTVPPGMKAIRTDQELSDWGGLNLFSMLTR